MAMEVSNAYLLLRRVQESPVITLCYSMEIPRRIRDDVPPKITSLLPNYLRFHS